MTNYVLNVLITLIGLLFGGLIMLIVMDVYEQHIKTASFVEKCDTLGGFTIFNDGMRICFDQKAILVHE